ncbi:BglG family transcription antiterminator [Acerihabitans sp. TG2]|uniref:BglG family transcription antiterminator n=1 Tax=Acerihabitans sp. TG2 TaxID=3096008 RepID=UPI002B23DCD6|nr:BglG family transcription antiterminator [Acerihabitans sp. TG2]MEA9389747.1 BglG family transcription antiterminator [Acerihabitans sp. TG2]
MFFEKCNDKINYKFYSIVNEFLDKKYHTAYELAKKNSVSEKTIRMRIKELNDILILNGAIINSKSKMGYQLAILNEEKFSEFNEKIERNDKKKTPTTSNERVLYVLALLLNRNEYIKLEEICDLLYVSRNTMTSILKKIDCILDVYNLSLDRRPYYGITIQGKEIDKRICIANNLQRRSGLNKENGHKQLELKIIGKIVLDMIYNHGLRISEISLDNFILHIYVSIVRVRQGFIMSIDNDKICSLIDADTLFVAKEIVSKIQEEISVNFPEQETVYLALHMEAKLSPRSGKNIASNIIISGEIDSLSLAMLDVIFGSFKIDFRNNLELRMSLNQHMVPFDIRMLYGIPLKNPLLDEIKKEYALAYTIAITACIVLKQHYKKNIPDDEIGYFAMIFELALEKKNTVIEKKNIVIVCSSGKGTTQLFMYKYKQAFGKYINNIYECTAYELVSFDFKANNIDYVFTTIPINMSVPVPVFEVNPFLEQKDIVTYSEMFKMGSNEFLKKYYSKSLFLNNINVKTKKEAIKVLCEHTKKYVELPDEFYDAVIKREDLGQTDFGNLVAIPHPFQVITKVNFVTVGILKESLWWGNNEVQVIFLIALSDEEDEDIERFYQLTTKLLFNKEHIDFLIENQKFEVMIDLLGSGSSPSE